MNKARILFAALVFITIGCHSPQEAPSPSAVAEGDAERGKMLVQKYGCGTCHLVPGVQGAVGTMGPPLAGIGDRPILMGGLPNEPANMVKWIRDPKEVNPRTFMPDLNIGAQEGSDIAAYLYTLKE